MPTTQAAEAATTPEGQGLLHALRNSALSNPFYDGPMLPALPQATRERLLAFFEAQRIWEEEPAARRLVA